MMASSAGAAAPTMQSQTGQTTIHEPVSTARSSGTKRRQRRRRQRLRPAVAAVPVPADANLHHIYAQLLAAITAVRAEVLAVRGDILACRAEVQAAIACVNDVRHILRLRGLQ